MDRPEAIGWRVVWSALLVVVIMAIGYLSGFVGAIDPYNEEMPEEVYLTSNHSTGLVFYNSDWRNDSASYQSRFKIYQNVTVTISGADIQFKLRLIDRNISWEGTTSANVTKLSVPINGTSVWIVLELGVGNSTRIHNFGISQITNQPVAVIVSEAPVVLTIGEVLKREWRVIVAGAVLSGSLMLLAYVSVTTWKKGRILVK